MEHPDVDKELDPKFLKFEFSPAPTGRNFEAEEQRKKGALTITVMQPSG